MRAEVSVMDVLPRLFVDYSWFGHSKRVTAQLFASELATLHVGDHVIVEGDSVSDREARVESITTASREATLAFVS